MIDLMPLARFMFDRQCDSYDTDPVMREIAWRDEQIRDFWYDEASAVWKFIQEDFG